MDRPSEFFPRQELDRTPVGACALVAGLSVLAFLAGFSLLWQAASLVKHSHFSIANLVLRQSVSAGADSLGQAAKDAAQQAQNAAGKAASSAAQSAAQQAADQVKQQAAQELQKEQGGLQDQLKSKLSP